ncbi:hypothetical protein V1477_009862 [Vespula maculifrons]|uniref:Uncharacterized protein n=1 Tax=Vespula maculifrons TaxID=7453 RepID=A0ABD2CD81_VESMC
MAMANIPSTYARTMANALCENLTPCSYARSKAFFLFSEEPETYFIPLTSKVSSDACRRRGPVGKGKIYYLARYRIENRLEAIFLRWLDIRSDFGAEGKTARLNNISRRLVLEIRGARFRAKAYELSCSSLWKDS